MPMESRRGKQASEVAQPVEAPAVQAWGCGFCPQTHIKREERADSTKLSADLRCGSERHFHVNKGGLSFLPTKNCGLGLRTRKLASFQVFRKRWVPSQH